MASAYISSSSLLHAARYLTSPASSSAWPRSEPPVWKRSVCMTDIRSLDFRFLSFCTASSPRRVSARAEFSKSQVDFPSATYQQSDGDDASGEDGLEEGGGGEQEDYDDEEEDDDDDAVGRAFSSSNYPPEGPKLYVGNLPFTCNSQQLAELFQEAGTVEIVEVIYDRDTGRSRGFGFVTMGSLDDANAAIQKFDGREFFGRRLRVSFPDRNRGEGSRMRFEDSSLNANKLFVGNLPWGLDDLTLENLFTEYGKVLEAKVVYDRESGRSRGFGFVTLSSPDEVNEAISKMDGAEIQGRPLRVNLASDRPPPRPSLFS